MTTFANISMDVKVLALELVNFVYHIAHDNIHHGNLSYVPNGVVIVLP